MHTTTSRVRPPEPGRQQPGQDQPAPEAAAAPERGARAHRAPEPSPGDAARRAERADVLAELDLRLRPDRRVMLSAELAGLEQTFAERPEDPAIADRLEAALGRFELPREARAEQAARARVQSLFTEAAAGAARLQSALAVELWLRAVALALAGSSGAVDAAIELLDRAVAAADPSVPSRVVALGQRIARAAAARLEVLDRLAALCRRAGEREGEWHMLLWSLDRVPAAADRAKRHRAIAALCREAGDAMAAAWHAGQADQLITGDARAAREHDRLAIQLADRAYRDHRWHELDPLLGWLLRSEHARARAGVPRAELMYRAGRAALELGKLDKARALYREALELDPVHLPALLEQAQAAAEMRDWGAAHDILGGALVVQRSLGRPRAELAETLCGMARALDGAGQPDRALALYLSAVDVYPAHRAALDAAVSSLRGQGDHAGADRLLRAALPLTRRARRVDLLVAVADVARALGDPADAADLCQEALDLSPGDKRVLGPLCSHLAAAGQPARALEAALSLAEMEDDRIARGGYYQLAAALVGPRAPGDAVGYLERALDCYFDGGQQPPATVRPTCLRAFEQLVVLLSAARQWKALERAYRLMIKRLAPGSLELPRLWSELGQIYRENLGHGASAIQSFEVASRLERDRLTHHRILIDLYQGFAPDQIDKLIERRRVLLAAEPFDPEHYRALRSLWARAGKRDRTYCACRVLCYLGAADRREQEFYRRHRPEGIVWPDRPLKRADWARLRHPDEDSAVGGVLALVAEQIGLACAHTTRQLRLSDDRSAEFEDLRRLYRQVARVLGKGQPALMVTPSLASDIVLANLRRGNQLTPAFVVGRHMYTGRSRAQMVHGMARALGYARPDTYLRLLLGSTREIAAALDAATAAAARSDTVRLARATSSETSRFRVAIERDADDRWRTRLRAQVARLRKRRARIDSDRWSRAVDATARRAGLLLAGDLGVAAADLAREPLFAQRQSVDQRMADLLIHSMSDEHFALRRSLGLAIDRRPG